VAVKLGVKAVVVQLTASIRVVKVDKLVGAADRDGSSPAAAEASVAEAVEADSL